MLLLARIQSLVPVNEPAIRVVVEVGCTRRMQREYVLLIDPPAATAAPALTAAKGPPSVAVADRLVLAMPEELKAAPDTRPSTVPDPSEELVRRRDQLSSEVKRLRGGLDSANQRNSVLADKLAQDHGWGLGWWIADVPLDLLVGDTAISGSVEHDRDVGKDAGGRADSVAVSDDGTGTDGQAGRHGDDAEAGARNQEPLARSQFPTTVLKPLELDLDLSDFAQRKGQRPPG